MAKAEGQRKSRPFSVRLSPGTDRLVEAEAKRTRRSKGAIVEAFTEETARARRFPGIGFRGDDARRRAWVIGSGLDVWEIVQMTSELGSIEGVVAETHVSEAQARLALAYRAEFPDEVEAMIADNQRPLDELRDLYPFITVEAGR